MIGFTMTARSNLWIPGILLLTTALITGCNQKAPDSVAHSLAVGPVPATIQRPGNPAAGYDALVNQPYISCGMPYSAFIKATGPPSPRQLLSSRDSRNRGLPYMLTIRDTDDGVRLVTSNCLSCHAGYFEDKLIIGLGNEFLDFTRDASVGAEQLGAYVTSKKDALEWKKWADRIATIAPYMRTDTLGVNPAVNLTFALMAHRNPVSLKWSDKALIKPPGRKPLPVSVPPWWRMKKKNALFYNTEGRGDHARIMMLAATLCTDSIEEARAIDRLAIDMRAYLASLKAPKYPYPVDSKLAAKGRTLFEQNCSFCHGTYGNDASYPNLVFHHEEVGTDAELARLLTSEENLRFVRWFNRSFFGENSRGEAAPGYIAPPLDGVWATAPYFHNGSVPSMEGVLNSEARPKYWIPPENPDRFNQKTLGWYYTEPGYGKESAVNRGEKKRIYDTTISGYSNTGHRYGDRFDQQQRATLIEYIKTL